MYVNEREGKKVNRHNILQYQVTVHFHSGEPQAKNVDLLSATTRGGKYWPYYIEFPPLLGSCFEKLFAAISAQPVDPIVFKI